MLGRSVVYEELTAPEVKKMIEGGVDLAIMPVGATDQHGPHLPLNVDTLIPEKIAHGVSVETGVPVYPSLAYGRSSSHGGLPATLSLRPETFQKIVKEVSEWAHDTGFRRILYLSGNLPNLPPLTCAILNLRMKCSEIRLKALNWWDITSELSKKMFGDSTCGLPHGNIVVTSVLRFFRDDLVDMSEAKAIPGRDQNLFFYYLLKQISRSGHCGDRSVSTPELGGELYWMVVEGLIPQVKAARTEEPPGY